jgi:hypothetical protein
LMVPDVHQDITIAPDNGAVTIHPG